MLKNNPNLVEPRVAGTGGSLLILVGFTLIGMAVGNLLAVFALTSLTSSGVGGTANIINQLMNDPGSIPDGWYVMMIFQGVVHLFSYLLPSLLFWYLIERRPLAAFNFRPFPKPYVWFMTFAVVLLFIPLNGQIIEWNSAMKLPGFLSEVENWMRAKEDQLAVMTKFLTSYQSIGQLLIALVVVVLLPSLGEEALFRGVIQRKLSAQMNIHAAIWISAAIFSTIHFQFYGFFPRMMLGALFGYLYYWTGNFWIAVLAHFVNNGFVLIMMYLYNMKVLDINIEETKTMPLLSVLLSLFFTGLILLKIKRASEKEQILN
ncbi:hypothetical protein DYBT9275_03652 [Dyadobacter sp. CECT 9275]|uniref:CAAX prenyl protease 2/Lysostaphin resistance protein A-like domain-containing protein n=1 Tax=Dyadobacter helix TaxID=2822344 RepID=A0A916JDU0_9BACT|nr:type II CAAX endopeptidase family protein [Dyadobacter sp. CECT 9275]CAG5005787.1 hypothetical protein DYBT9275_03652 [Dyadobacter sp. CECT 9275]